MKLIYRILSQSCFVLFMVLLVSNCSKTSNDIPDCIYKKVREMRNNTTIEEIRVLVHNGKRYYALVPGCCDQYTVFYDEDCNYICSTGGISGLGDGECTREISNAKLIKTVKP